MQEKCSRCGHDKSSHLFHKFEDGEGPTGSTHCKIDSCTCEAFSPLVCNECGEPLKPSQYARREKADGTAFKNTDVLACRNYPNCTKAEKEVFSH